MYYGTTVDKCSIIQGISDEMEFTFLVRKNLIHTLLLVGFMAGGQNMADLKFST